METHTVILVPGAWSGAWVWEPTAQQLRDQGILSQAVTLRGLESDSTPTARAAVRLEDHVQQVSNFVNRTPGPVVLVGHSYSSMVTVQVADRLGLKVAGLIHVGGFIPTDGASLLDQFDEATRERERMDIANAGNLWPAPERHMLELEGDLSHDQQDFLLENFTPHPGSTVIDAARLTATPGSQPTTYVALTTKPDEVPTHLRNTLPEEWRVECLVSGHWPMLTHFAEVVALLERETLRFGLGQG